MEDFASDELFKKADFRKNHKLKKEYDNCRFSHCNFSGVKLTDMVFINCIFESCNLGMTGLPNTAFRDIKFKKSRITGVNFNTCNEFGFTVSFEDCNLNSSSFYQRKMIKTFFKNTDLKDVDFTECDLSESIFSDCDLKGAVFHRCNLEKSDFRTSSNYSIDPELNRIKKAKFSIPDVIGLLDKYQIQVDL